MELDNIKRWVDSIAEQYKKRKRSSIKEDSKQCEMKEKKECEREEKAGRKKGEAKQVKHKK